MAEWLERLTCDPNIAGSIPAKNHEKYATACDLEQVTLPKLASLDPGVQMGTGQK